MKRINVFILIAIVLVIVLLGILIYSTLNPAGKTTSKANASTGINPAKGNSSSKIIIIEFSDFQCPKCKAALPVIDAVLDRYGVALYYRNFPLPMHKNSMNAAEAAECANEQEKFWQYHDILFQNQEMLDKESLKRYAAQLGLDAAQFNSCLDSHKYRNEIEKDFQDGEKLGVGGTPTFFINNRKIEGASLGVFESIIKEEMSNA
ncbi:thioredoxin domain-containing protein [Candidatus Pacearchaeota archaeon]|nr:thioredoxin domain-containing protein [Candidatus Pacearchaeota archaeon]